MLSTEFISVTDTGDPVHTGPCVGCESAAEDSEPQPATLVTTAPMSTADVMARTLIVNVQPMRRNKAECAVMIVDSVS